MVEVNIIFICSKIDSFTGKNIDIRVFGKKLYKKWDGNDMIKIVIMAISLIVFNFIIITNIFYDNCHNFFLLFIINYVIIGLLEVIIMKLQIKDLAVEIDKKIILDKFNLNIKEGSIHVIMGPNGVGKSTLSRVIMGDTNYQIIEGDILFDGESIIRLRTDEIARKGIFLAMQSPMEIEGVSNQDFLRTAISQKNEERIGLYQFIKECEVAVNDLKMNKDLIHRGLNVGFSGGEKKKNEVLQIKLLKPSFIILDELDSGLDVDSLRIVCENILNYKKENPNTAILIITHYSMILEYLKPDYVHILANRHIIKTGDYQMVGDIEKNGYSKYLDSKNNCKEEML